MDPTLSGILTELFRQASEIVALKQANDELTKQNDELRAALATKIDDIVARQAEDSADPKAAVR